MSEEHFTIIERASLAPDDEHERRLAALQKTSGLLYAWRHRFTDTTPSKVYTLPTGKRISVHSDTPESALVHVRATDGSSTTYDLNTIEDTLDVTEREATSERTVSRPPNYEDDHAELARLLFDCSQSELRG